MKKKQKRSTLHAHQQDLLKQPWTPLVLCEPDLRAPNAQTYRNSRYQVHLRRYSASNGGPDLIHLSLNRLDQAPFIPYRDKMRIKDELCGTECEGVELFPARSREVDLANQSHLWVVDDSTFRFPFGFRERLVSDLSIGGVQQDPWPENEKPVDSLSQEDLQKRFREKGTE